MKLKKGYSNIIINYLRKVVDKYDNNHKLKVKKIFICKNSDTRNRNKRTEFVIPKEQPQCPVYKDNRCCGGCDYAPTCDYAINCNCYGFSYACLGGTDEGYYMRDRDYAEFGRIGKDGKFDWDFYNDNAKRRLLKVGTYTSVEDLKSIRDESIAYFINENSLKYFKIIGEIDPEGNVLVDCSLYDLDKEFTINIRSLRRYAYDKNEALLFKNI